MNPISIITCFGLTIIALLTAGCGSTDAPPRADIAQPTAPPSTGVGSLPSKPASVDAKVDPPSTSNETATPQKIQVPPVTAAQVAQSPNQQDDDQPLGDGNAVDARKEINGAEIAPRHVLPTIEIPDHWQRLSPTDEIWLDKTGKQVILGGQICFRQGPLEMLICPRNTKEHESVISANVVSWQVHAALLALGNEKGSACSWAPDYKPAWGPTVHIDVVWRAPDTQQIKTIDGKQWALNIDTNRPMAADLVFGGSVIEKDPETGRTYYSGNSGPLVCLANFGNSTIDLKVDNPNDQPFYEANTALIPALGTQVYAKIRLGPSVGKPTADTKPQSQPD